MYPKAWTYLESYQDELRLRESKRDNHGVITSAPFDDDEWYRFGRHQNLDKQEMVKIIVPRLVASMLLRLAPKSTRFGDNLVGTLAHWLLARLSPLHFGCCHEPVYSPSYVGATACPLIPSNDRNALNG